MEEMTEPEIDLTTSSKSYALYLFKDHKVGQWTKLRCELRSWNRLLVQYSFIKFLRSTGHVDSVDVLIMKKVNQDPA